MSDNAKKKPLSFSWDIHYVCNYRCPYCWFHGHWQVNSKDHPRQPASKWLAAWERVYRRYGEAHIEIVGGEPFIYPGFAELVEELSRMHTLGISTNLSADIRGFASRVDPKRVKVLPTLHPLFADTEAFMGKVRLLRDRGLTGGVLCLAYPPQLKLIDRLRKRFHEAGMGLSVSTFWGEHKGIHYPEGYTDEERNFINDCLGQRDGASFQTDPIKRFKGRLCNAGFTYAVVKPDGEVMRCGGSTVIELLDNFFDPDFSMLEAPAPCRSECCKCNEWAFLLAGDAKEDRPKETGPGCIVEPPAADPQGALEIFRRNKELNKEETAQKKIILESKPLRLGVIVTDWCNLRCIMCPQIRHKGGAVLPASALPKINPLLPYLERLDWQGGEFFGFKHIKEFFATLAPYQQVRHEITTNGLLLDKEWIEILLGLSTNIAFSIDSPREETYEYIRQGGRYRDLLERLRWVQELEARHGKTLQRSITAVVMRCNYRHLFEFIDFARQYGFWSLNFNPVMHTESEENIFIDPTLDLAFLDETKMRMEKACRDLGIRFGWQLPGLAAHRESACAPDATQCTNIQCNLPWKSLWVCADRNGAILPDCWCDTPAGNIFQDELLEVWNNETMQRYRKNMLAGDASFCSRACVNDYSSTVNYKNYDS